MSRKPTTQQQRDRRRRLIRRLLVECQPEAEIVAAVEAGVVDTITGAKIQASASTVRRDLAAIAEEFRAHYSDEDAVEREIGACIDRYRRIADLALEGRKGDKAAGTLGVRPNLPAALAANDRLLKLAASRSESWRYVAGTPAVRWAAEQGTLSPVTSEEDEELVAKASELTSLSLEELRSVAQGKVERLERDGLIVLDGGK